MSREFARKLRRNSSDAEQFLWSRLRGRRFAGWKIRRQALVGRYIADFVCFDRQLIVELDGGQHAAQVEPDAERSRWLGSQGFRVIRFWNHQVFEETDSVLETIWIAIQCDDRIESTPTLPSAPARGRPKQIAIATRLALANTETGAAAGPDSRRTRDS